MGVGYKLIKIDSVVVFWPPLLCPCILKIIAANRAFMLLTREILTNPVCQIDVLEFFRQVIKKVGKINLFSKNLLVWLI